MSAGGAEGPHCCETPGAGKTFVVDSREVRSGLPLHGRFRSWGESLGEGLEPREGYAPGQADCPVGYKGHLVEAAGALDWE